MLFTTAGSVLKCAMWDARFVSVYRLTQPGCKLAVNDSIGTAETPGKRNTGSGLDWWYSLVAVVASSTICSRCKHVDLSC